MATLPPPTRKKVTPQQPTRATQVAPTTEVNSTLHASTPLACQLNGQSVSMVEIDSTPTRDGAEIAILLKYGAKVVSALTFTVGSGDEAALLREDLFAVFGSALDGVMHATVGELQKAEQGYYQVCVRLSPHAEQVVRVEGRSGDEAAIAAMKKLGWPHLTNPRHLAVYAPNENAATYPFTSYSVFIVRQDDHLIDDATGVFVAPDPDHAAQMAVAEFGRAAAEVGGWQVIVANPYTGEEYPPIPLHRFKLIAGDTQLRVQMSRRQQLAPPQPQAVGNEQFSPRPQAVRNIGVLARLGAWVMGRKVVQQEVQ